MTEDIASPHILEDLSSLALLRLSLETVQATLRKLWKRGSVRTNLPARILQDAAQSEKREDLLVFRLLVHGPNLS
jgi:hypothetical protein